MQFLKILQARVRGIIYRSKLRNEYKINKNLLGNHNLSYKNCSLTRIVKFIFLLKLKQL